MAKKKPATVEEEHKGESTFVSPQQSQHSSDEESQRATKKSKKTKPETEEEVEENLKKGKDPAAPPRVPSKYNLFVKLFGKEIVEAEDREVPNKERMKVIGEAFKKITKQQEKAIEKETKVQEKLHEKRLKEYEKHGYYILEDGTKSNAKSVKNNKAAPKKLIQSHTAFMQLFGNKIAEEHADRIKKEGNSARMKIIMEEYKKATKAQLAKVDKLIEEDTKRLEKQQAEFEKKGYYTMDDGTRSDMAYVSGEGMPKKVLTQRQAFLKLYTSEIKAKLGDKFSLSALTQEAAERCKNLTKKEEKEITKLIAEDQKRYETERAEFNEKGYYTLPNGKRSDEAKAKRGGGSNKKEQLEKNGKVKSEDYTPPSKKKGKSKAK